MKWADFPKITTNTELIEYFSWNDDKYSRAKNHEQYCHYTRLSALDSILQSKTIRLGCVTEFNDVVDKQQFGSIEEQILYYSLCFSTGKNENLPLWYLYSSMDGQGARIRMSKSTIAKLLENAQYALLKVDSSSKKVVKRIELKPTDIDVKFEDVLYYRVHEGTNKVDLKYNTMTNYSIPMDEFKIYQQVHTGFLKGLIWYYEKETRLLIKLRGAVADSIRNRVKDIERGEIKYKIELSLETIYPKIIIDFGPEMDSLDDCWHLTSGKEFNGIRDFIYSTSRTHLSSYKGTIKMNLCQKCDKR